MRVKLLRVNLLVTACTILLPFASNARDVLFNPRMLALGEGNFENTDLDYFSRQGGQMPGSYDVDIYVNNNYIDTRRINFVADSKHKDTIRPELSPGLLSELGVRLNQQDKPADMTKPLPEGLETYIASATTIFNVKNLRLDISVPQASMDRAARGSVSPELWDDGVNAILLDYHYNGSQAHDLNNNGDSQDDFLAVHSGINFQAWRFRYDGTLTRSDTDNNDTGNDSSDNNQDNGTHWKSLNTYIQRNYNILQGIQMTLGQYNTPGTLFDGMQFTGAQLASDDDMLPDSMQNFAPTITGIARTTSLLTVRQGGNVVYQTTVSPGPYAINDLYSLGGSGDLQVTVKESDGQITQYTVPFSTLPVMQRQGRYKFSLTGGEYRTGNNDTETPEFLEGTLSAGLPADFTLYGGGQYADNYKSTLLGIGRNMGYFGAISIDSTYARTNFDANTKSGTKNRFQYQKEFTVTNSTLRASVNNYTSEYYTFSDRQDYHSTSGSDTEIYDRTHNRKNEYTLSLTQTAQNWGSLSLSGYIRDYYDSGDKEKNWQTSYTNSLYGVNYTLAYSETDNAGVEDTDRRFSLNISVPLDRFLSSNHMWVNYNMNTEQNGQTSNLVGLSGTTLEDNNLNYAVSQGYRSGDVNSGSTGTASADYKGRYGEANASYSYDPDSRQISYGLQGGILLHADGVTLSQPMNDTVVLVKAPGAADVRVENNAGVRTDWRGYTVIPYAQPYRKNRVFLDTRTFGDDVDMDKNIDYVVPTKGAVVLAHYATRVGKRALFTVHDSQGKAIPFGAMATLLNSDSTVSGIVDENGTVYMTGLPDTGSLNIQWSDTRHCSADYHFPKNTENTLVQQPLVCRK